MHQPKREYSNKNEDNSPNRLNDENNQASSQGFRQIRSGHNDGYLIPTLKN